MEPDPNPGLDRDWLTRYLLGELSEREQIALEKDFSAERDRFDELWAAEDDLIDDYLRGNLGESDREQFEKRFLSTSWGRERLQASRVFLAAITKVDPRVR